MKNILVIQGAGANHHIRTSLCHAYQVAGYNVLYWNSEGKSAFDVFNEFPCDFFLGDTWQLSRPIVKNLVARPEIKVVLYADAFGDIQKDIDLNKYPVGVVTDEQLYHVESLIKSGVNLKGIVTNHGQQSLEYTHGYWKSKLGLDISSLLTSADITTFFPRQKDERYQTELFFCGGYWNFKAQNLDQYIKPLTYPTVKWKVRISGNGWTGVNSVGIVSDEETAKHYTNSRIIPHVVEPHASNTDGYSDIPLRYTQVAACGGFGISCPCNGIREVFSEDELVVAENPSDFFEKIVNFLNNQEETIPYRQKAMKKVLDKHTGFDRCIQLMNNILGEDSSALQVAKKELVERNFNEGN